MTYVIERDDRSLTTRPGRWVAAWDGATGQWVWVEVAAGWLWLEGWPGWAKYFPENFTGLTDPVSKRVWRRKGSGWSLKGVLHERHHPAFQANRLGRLIFALHVLRYLFRFGYLKSRLERDATAGRDRALAWWEAHGRPSYIPLEANHWEG